MKKYIYALLLLSAAGACISALLLIQHYYPDTQAGTLLCGSGMVNSCISLSQSGYATLFTVPIAAYGLFYYLFFLFTILIADYAGEAHHPAATSLLLPLSILGLVADIILAVILVHLHHFCMLCILTYLANMALAALIYLWYRSAREGEDRSFRGIVTVLKNFCTAGNNRGLIAAFTLFVVFLLFDVFSSSHIMRLNAEKRKIPGKTIASYVNRFYTSKKEEPLLPESGMQIGNPEADITLVIFTDFLCSACYSMFRTEKFLFSKFPGRIRIVYYHYPLDTSCNDSVNRTVYNNSCVASRAFAAASELGILEQYQVLHFSDYKKIRAGYDTDTALRIFTETAEKAGLTGVSVDRFRKIMYSKKTGDEIRLHCKKAAETEITATPTMFLGGRKMVGVPPREVLSAIIDIEISRKSN